MKTDHLNMLLGEKLAREEMGQQFTKPDMMHIQNTWKLLLSWLFAWYVHSFLFLFCC